MKKNYNYPGWTKRAALSVAALCLATSAAHAQTTALATDFETTQTVNGTTTPTTYASPNYADTYQSNTDPNAAGPTAPLATQNGWTTNDAPGPIGHGTTSTNANQINGGTTYVGGIGFFGGGQAAAVGAGVYAATASTPVRAVPSAASNGTVTVSHAVAGTNASQVVLNLDYVLVSLAATPTNTLNVAKDLFAFSLTSTSGANILSLNFNPSSDGSQFNITTTGSATSTASIGSTLNTQYHLKLTLNSGQNGSFSAQITGGTGPTSTLSGTLAGSIAQFGGFTASETLSTADSVLSGGGYTGASDNYLGFDNLNIVVPEPSTYAMMTLGLVGLAGMVRLRRRQA